MWYAHDIARFMIDDPEVIRHMVQFTYILGACLPLMAVEFSMAGALRGAGDTRYPMMVTVFSILLTRIIAPLGACHNGCRSSLALRHLFGRFLYKI